MCTCMCIYVYKLVCHMFGKHHMKIDRRTKLVYYNLTLEKRY